MTKIIKIIEYNLNEKNNNINIDKHIPNQLVS